MPGIANRAFSLIKESGITLPSNGTTVRGASTLEKMAFTNSSIPLNALITTIMAAVIKATTTIEIPEIKLMIPRDFLANKCLRAM
jgi:hypothetical protein